MKIAVTYENGQIFQHFGKSRQFKIYEVNEDSILSSEVLESKAEGHDGLAALLKEKGVAVLICGGIGNGARLALGNASIQIMPGASGEADEAVTSFLNGNLHFDTGGSCASCAHHGDGDDDEGFIGACGHSCF